VGRGHETFSTLSLSKSRGHLMVVTLMRVAHSSAFLYGVTRPLRDGGPRASSSLSGGVVSSHAVIGGY